jgi:Zn-dependent peptidase ImmA (M78 family)
MISPFAFANKIKPVNTSREQIRSFLSASYTVLGFHNLFPKQTIKIYIKDLDSDECPFGGSSGLYNVKEMYIALNKNNNPEEMLTTCLHESIHSVCDFGYGTDEKCTSTLVAKLKADVAIIAQLLLDNTYKRAAYIAHTKLAYRAKNGDHYDDNQWRTVGVRSKYANKRVKR